MKKFLKLSLVLILFIGLVNFGATCLPSSDSNTSTTGSTTGGTTGGTTSTNGTISVTVTSGTTPQFSWSGGNIYSLIVNKTNDTTIAWGISSFNISGYVNGISSPVTYGNNPQGTVQVGLNESKLTSGVQYTVSVSRINVNTGQPQDMGFTIFTP